MSETIYTSSLTNKSTSKGDRFILYHNTNIKTKKCQDKNLIELKDIDAKGKKIDWRSKKMANLKLAEAYDKIDKNKAERLRQCSTVLQFHTFDIEENEQKVRKRKLHSMNSCRVHLCPICSWRRSRKTFFNTMKIIKEANKKNKYAYIFLTLTVKNCDAEHLNETIDLIMSAFNNFMRRKRIKKAVRGWLRCLEINHDVHEIITKVMYTKSREYYKSRLLKIDDKNPNYDMYHPHLHVLLCVNKSYFTSRDYMSQAAFQELWKDCLNVDYDPSVNVKRCYGTSPHAVAECSKYATKSTDYIIQNDLDLTVNTVRLLDKVIHKRRLIAYGGLFKEIKKRLELEDENLINLNEENAEEQEENFKIESYFWYSGYSNYYMRKKD